MSNYWNWYFECPYCNQEVECHVEDNRAPDGNWYTAELPDECPLCDSRFVEDWDKLEEETVEHYEEYHRTACKDDDWFEMVDWPRNIDQHNRRYRSEGLRTIGARKHQ